MDTTLIQPATQRRHRRHTPEFKAQVIAACLQPGVSIAAVALANQLNANFLRGWVKAHREQAAKNGLIATTSARQNDAISAKVQTPTLVPVTIKREEASSTGHIEIEIRRPQTVFQISWPSEQAAVCARWLSKVLR